MAELRRYQCTVGVLSGRNSSAVAALFLAFFDH